MDEPRTREEQYLSKIAGEDILIPAPVTRQEKYLAKMAGEDVDVPKAVTRVEHYYEGVIKVIEESVKPEPLTVTENGTYAESGKAYNPVTVNVPTYGAADVGKVVTESSGEYALTPQTSQSITANGTYDTTLNNEV
ncbi:MAG: hypothetical protein J6Y15_10540, partial [Bacteroidaceae bacterium]|nr:hypothetical protein [Bacteroidaceae bacterium]